MTDSPWRRLTWTLPSAILIWAVALWGLAHFMAKPSRQNAALPPIDAQFIEQSVPAAIQNIHHERPAGPHKSEPLPPVSPKNAEQNPAARKQETKPNIITAAPGAPSPGALALPGGAQPFNPSANRSTQTGSGSGNGAPGGNMSATSGARAIIRPMPQIPDDLREEAFNTAALVRFHVAADGSSTAELARPTPNPRLNRILLDSLNKWRFIPAIKNGKPVASTEEIVMKIEVH